MKNELAILVASALMLAAMPAWASHNHHKKYSGKHYLKHHNKYWRKHHAHQYGSDYGHRDKHRYITRIYASPNTRYCPRSYSGIGHWGFGFSFVD